MFVVALLARNLFLELVLSSPQPPALFYKLISWKKHISFLHWYLTSLPEFVPPNPAAFFWSVYVLHQRLIKFGGQHPGMNEMIAVQGGITLNVLIFLQHLVYFLVPHKLKAVHMCLKYKLSGKWVDFWGYMLKYRKRWGSEFRIFLFKAKFHLHTQAEAHTHNLYQQWKQQKKWKINSAVSDSMVGSPGHQKSERCGCWYLGLAPCWGCQISSDKTGIALKNARTCSCTSTVALEIQILILPQPCDLDIFGPIHPWLKKNQK